jgi:hypothetical protein
MQFFAPGLDLSRVPVWPPDAFALCAGVLQRSGAYLDVVHTWPPTSGDYATTVTDIGRKWRAAAGRDSRAALPRELEEWWTTVFKARDVPLEELTGKDVAKALLQLAIGADEACVGAGFLRTKTTDAFQFWATKNALEDSTLCSSNIAPSRAVVLPKMHTPQTGMTLRSITHNLAFYCPGEVRPRWKWIPALPPEQEIDWNFRLLLLPWPKQFDPKAFRPSRGELTNIPRDFGFFRCDSATAQIDLDEVTKIYRKAETLAGRIDAIVLPELALRPDDPAKIAQQTGAFVVGGCGVPPADRKPGENFAVMCAPGGQSSQHKHHRWRLEERQIAQYDLGERLDPTRQWWEHIRLTNRELNFVAMSEWLLLSFLICEDLARLDPVNQLLHAVAPTLVIALLMDGPQLASRWGARYATVLADDPGSSVLTLTSLGMCMASKVPDKPPSRVVALWKDSMSGPREITLEENMDGIVLCLRREYRTEWAADGRPDDGNTAYLRYHRVIQVQA